MYKALLFTFIHIPQLFILPFAPFALSFLLSVYVYCVPNIAFP